MIRTQRPLRVLTIALGAFGAAWVWSGAASAQPAANTGTWIVDTRLRYEGVSQDGLDDASALTFRARLGYETQAFHGVRGLIEAEGVGHLNDDFNDTLNGRTAFATVPDPEGLELNRLQLAWTGEEGRRAVVGRQRIVLNNARFIGNAGFRQNEQTFDAVRLEARPMPHLALTYLYLDDVYRTLGNRSPQGEWHSNSHVVEADLDGAYGKLSGYALLLDFPNAAPQSSETYGARWQKAWDVGAYNVRLTLEAAQQSNYGNAPTRLIWAIRARNWSCGAAIGAARWAVSGFRAMACAASQRHCDAARVSRLGRRVRQHPARRRARSLCRRLLQRATLASCSTGRADVRGAQFQ